MADTSLSHVSRLGERKVIDLIMSHLEVMPDMPIPFWDDVSAVALRDGRLAILKTDMLVWTTDVPKGMTFYQAARKAVVMNISDLGAKGVQPTAVLISLGLPRDIGVTQVEEIAKGINDGAREYGAYLIGGDTCETREIIMSGMAFGVGDAKRIMRRDGARPGDILATTGLFGKTGAAFKILLENLLAPPDLGKDILDAVYMPQARVKEGLALSESGAVTACMDSSDGLAISLHELSRSAHTGFMVKHLPLASEGKKFAELNALDPIDLVLYAGEEYELVFTVRPEMIRDARRALSAVGGNLIEIGTVTKSRKITLETETGLKTIKASGWEHFKSRP